MNEETELKYKVGDVVLVKVEITGVDPDDDYLSYETDNWHPACNIIGLMPKEEA